MKKKILVVDDEKNIVDILKYNLEREDFEVMEAYDGEEAVETALNKRPDMVLLDIMLPKMDGYSVCLKIRERLNVPILMLTAKDDEVDRILGIELGADDFITKPFSTREVIARVKANFRRVASEEFLKGPGSILKCGNLFLDLDKSTIINDGMIIDLTFKEFELVKFLALNRGKVFTRQEIIEKAWNNEYFRDIRIVNVTVGRIRRKLEKDFRNPKYIISKPGEGYYFSK